MGSQRAKRVSEVDSSCRLLIAPLFRGSSRFESLIVSHHSKFICECNKKEINDDGTRRGDEAHVYVYIAHAGLCFCLVQLVWYGRSAQVFFIRL